MSRPDLDGILARANAATPGPELTIRGYARTNAVGLCLGCDSWTPAGHEEAHDHAEGCPSEAAERALLVAKAALYAAARTDIPILVAYARELEATLANERGEGGPPVPGWEPYLHNGRVRWSRELADGVYDIVREAGDAPGWIHRHRHSDGRVTGTDGHHSARAAMRAASVPA